MKHSGVILWLLAIGLSVVPTSALAGECMDAADESHHQLLFENADARVLLLELPRIASTQPYCQTNPYLYIVTGDSGSSTTPDEKATFSHDWHAGEARFIYSPAKQVIANELMVPFRELIVELCTARSTTRSTGLMIGTYFLGTLARHGRPGRSHSHAVISPLTRRNSRQAMTPLSEALTTC